MNKPFDPRTPYAKLRLKTRKARQAYHEAAQRLNAGAITIAQFMEEAKRIRAEDAEREPEPIDPVRKVVKSRHVASPKPMLDHNQRRNAMRRKLFTAEQVASAVTGAVLTALDRVAHGCTAVDALECLGAECDALRASLAIPKEWAATAIPEGQGELPMVVSSNE